LLNTLVVENLRHRPVRTCLSILAVGVEVTMILTLVGISTGTMDETARRARGVGADILVRKTPLLGASSASMNQDVLNWFRKQPHIAFATGTMIQPISLLDSLTGVDLAALETLGGKFRFLQGGPFRGDDDIIIDDYYAKERNLQIGSEITLSNHQWRVAGIFESGKLAHVCTRLNVLQEITSNRQLLSQIYLKTDDPNRAKAVAEGLGQKLPGFYIYTMQDITSLANSNSIGLLRNFIRVVVGIAVIVGFIVVFMAMYTAVLERTREIGVLKALGASPAYILNLLFREALLIAIVGTAAGILLTYGTQWIMQHAGPASLTQVTVFQWWPRAAAIAIMGSLAGAIVPAVKALKQDAVEALSYE
jgi:putative ABC transport system permease protein